MNWAVCCKNSLTPPKILLEGSNSWMKRRKIITLHFTGTPFTWHVTRKCALASAVCLGDGMAWSSMPTLYAQPWCQGRLSWDKFIANANTDRQEGWLFCFLPSWQRWWQCPQCQESHDTTASGPHHRFGHTFWLRPTTASGWWCPVWFSFLQHCTNSPHCLKWLCRTRRHQLCDQPKPPLHLASTKAFFFLFCHRSQRHCCSSTSSNTMAQG